MWLGQRLGFVAFVATYPALWFLEKLPNEVVASPKYGKNDEELLPHVN